MRWGCSPSRRRPSQKAPFVRPTFDETSELTVAQHRAQIQQQAQHRGTLHVQQFVHCQHLRAEMSVAAHRLLGEADGRILEHAEDYLSNLM